MLKAIAWGILCLGLCARISEAKTTVTTQPFGKIADGTPVQIFTLNDGLSTEQFLQTLHDHGVQAGPMGRHGIRFVFHLDVADDQVAMLLQTLRSLRVAA